MPPQISASNSMLRQPSGDHRVSYCKKPGHEREEIEGACYQCADTFCKYCIEAHKDHYLIFFQDSYLKNNYESVQQIPTDIQAEPEPSWQREPTPTFFGCPSGKVTGKGSGKQGDKGASTGQSAAPSTIASTDTILTFSSTSTHLNLSQNSGQPRAQPEAMKKLLPSIEAFVAKDKYS